MSEMINMEMVNRLMVAGGVEGDRDEEVGVAIKGQHEVCSACEYASVSK